LTEQSDKELFAALLDSVYLSFPERGRYYSYSPHYKYGCGYDIKDLNGDGTDELILLNADYTVVALFTFSNAKPVLLGNYHPRNTCWIDGEGRIHVDSQGSSTDVHHQIYRLDANASSLTLLEEYGSDTILFPSTHYYQVVNGQKKRITEENYKALVLQHGTYNGLSGKEATAEYAGLSFTRIFEESEIAMEMYAAALEGTVWVYSNYTSFRLKNWTKPDGTAPLREAETLAHAYVDVDQDGVNELLIEIDYGETVLLRYSNGQLSLHTFASPRSFNEDGTYSWTDNGQSPEYGERRICFENNEMRSKELWRIVNEGEPNARYYIEGRSVTAEEMQIYRASNQKNKLTFSPLDAAWKNKVSPAQALEIAKDYWKELDPVGNDYIIARSINSSTSLYEYVFVIRRWVEDHYSVFDEIWIDVNTGTVTSPVFSDGKGEKDRITPEEAKQLAESHWGFSDGYTVVQGNTTKVYCISVVGIFYEHCYYIKCEVYAYWNEDYENGGEHYNVQAYGDLFLDIFTGEEIYLGK
jgi:hypothetical protein